MSRFQDEEIPFGKYRGERFEDVPLTYLDWLRGQDWLDRNLKRKIENYLDEPAIKKLLAEEIGDD